MTTERAQPKARYRGGRASTSKNAEIAGQGPADAIAVRARSREAVEDSPDRQGDKHDRRRPGLNHVALHVDSPDRVEQLVEAGTTHGWRLLFADRHPYAGGPDHYAAYLENTAGFEVELVAGQPSARAAD